MQEEQVLVNFMTEQKDGHGEDAPPICFCNNDSYAVGVFDGMGGAGSAICDSEYGGYHTKAYVASRIVRKRIEEFLIESFQQKRQISPEEMKQVLVERLKKEQEKYPSKSKSALKTKLIREYPTTMALVTLQKADDKIRIDSYWAGDSRCYMWTEKGIFQISKDDLEADSDPMENLHNDSPISNCICADRDFSIRHYDFEISNEPVIIFCATDGCFGYYPSPMHFEDMLKDCLRNSSKKAEWEDKIMDSIKEVTGDDSSFALIPIGYSSFEDIKKRMSKEVTGFSEILDKDHEMEESQRKLKDAQNELNEKQKEYKKLVSDKWHDYKNIYMEYINKYINYKENGDA